MHPLLSQVCYCHCEERSDEAIPIGLAECGRGLLCFARNDIRVSSSRREHRDWRVEGGRAGATGIFFKSHSTMLFIIVGPWGGVRYALEWGTGARRITL